MEKKDLLEYSRLRGAEKDLEMRIRKSMVKSEKYQKLTVSDVVKGSRGEYDIYGPISVEGFYSGKYSEEKAREDDYRTELERTRDEIRTKRIQIESFIRAIPEGTDICRIIRYKCEDALTWRQVADKMGGGYTADGCRKIFNRYLKKPGN